MKKYLALITILLCLGLNGCMAGGSGQLTEEENNMIAEYIAGVLLKYDMRYEDSLQYEDPEGETDSASDISEASPEPVKENIKDAATDSSITKEPGEGIPVLEGSPEPVYTDLTDLYGSEGITVSYAGGRVCDSYPDSPQDSYAFIEPSDKEKKLLVLTFKLVNTSSSKKTMNLFDSDIKYKLEGENGGSTKPLLTFIDNDLQYLNVAIGAGKTKKSLLIFEVPKNYSTGSSSLLISKGETVSKITV